MAEHDEETVILVSQATGTFDTLDEAVQDALRYMPPGSALEVHEDECEIAKAECSCVDGPKVTSVFSEQVQ